MNIKHAHYWIFDIGKCLKKIEKNVPTIQTWMTSFFKFLTGEWFGHLYQKLGEWRVGPHWKWRFPGPPKSTKSEYPEIGLWHVCFQRALWVILTLGTLKSQNFGFLKCGSQMTTIKSMNSKSLGGQLCSQSLKDDNLNVHRWTNEQTKCDPSIQRNSIQA